MPLSLLRAVVDSIADDGTCPIAQDAIRPWAHEHGPVRFVRASANVIFRFSATGGEYVLRLTPTQHRSPAAIAAELVFLRHLATAGVPLAGPVPALSGPEVRTVDTRLGSFHATVFAALHGTQYELSDLPAHCLTRWGQALGRLHHAARGHPGTGRPRWTDQLPALPAEEADARRLLHRVTDRLARLPATTENFGLIHGDFELDNLIWTAGHIPMIVDFDDSAHHWLAADIAFALRDLRDPETGHLDPHQPAVRDFLQGYRTQHPVADPDLARIPLFLRLHDLTTFAGLLHALDLSQADASPDWLVTLRRKLTRKLDSYRCQFTTESEPGL